MPSQALWHTEQQQQQQQQRLEVAAAAVLVHAASCKNAQCPVPHCNKMKKIHSHFLECSTTDCGICKKQAKRCSNRHDRRRVDG